MNGDNLPAKASTSGRNILTVEVTNPLYTAFERFMTYMPNPDKILQDTNHTLQIYEDMQTDPKISSQLEIRKNEILSYEYSIIPGEDTPQGQEIADFVSMNFERINFRGEMKEMLSALDFGFSVSEMVWEQSSSRWLLSVIKNRKSTRFQFKPDGTLMHHTLAGLKPLDIPYKFVIHRHNPASENFYGNSLLKTVYWPWMFKKAGLRFWLTAAEKFSVPTVLALFTEHDEKTAKKRAEDLASNLRNIHSDSAVGLSNIDSVQLLESQGLEEFKTLIELCNTEISYGITGQTLATAESQYGTRAQGEVHERTLEKMSAGDAEELEHTINKDIIASLVRLNYGPDVPLPKISFDTEGDASWEVVRDAIDRNVPVSKKAIHRKYRIPEPEDDEDTFVKPAQGGGSLMFSDTQNEDNFFLPSRKYLILNRKSQKQKS